MPPSLRVAFLSTVTAWPVSGPPRLSRNGIPSPASRWSGDRLSVQRLHAVVSGLERFSGEGNRYYGQAGPFGFNGGCCYTRVGFGWRC